MGVRAPFLERKNELSMITIADGNRRCGIIRGHEVCSYRDSAIIFPPI